MTPFKIANTYMPVYKGCKIIDALIRSVVGNDESVSECGKITDDVTL